MVKDDENLSSQKFNPFEDRVKQTLKNIDRAEWAQHFKYGEKSHS